MPPIPSPFPATNENIRAAADLLRQGRLVAMPTETVYGLAADATDSRAVAAIYAAKGRPSFNPLIVHVAELADAESYGHFSAAALKLGAALWPGPLTLVVRRRADCGIAELASAGLDTLALRIPAHPVALALIRDSGRPLAAPSANPSGRLSPTRAADVAAELGDKVAMVLDGGTARHGLESTVVDLTGDAPILLRPGAITTDEIERILGRPLARVAADSVTPNGADTARPSSPGQLASHYAPRAELRLNAALPLAGEALLAFGPDAPVHDGPSLNLSPSGDLVEAAAGLFAGLRSLDASGVHTIAVMPIPSHGLGEAINDRLRRAAAPRG